MYARRARLHQVLLALLVLLLAAWLSCRNYELTDDTSPTVSIGVLYFGTGSAAQYGQWVREGLELALRDINAKENSPRFRLEFEDDQTSPRIAVAAYEKLTSAGLRIIIAGLTSSSTLAVAPRAEEDGVLLFSPCSSAPAITDAGEFIFRNWPSDTLEGRALADFAINQLRTETAAIVAMNNDYGRQLADIFGEAYTSIGGQVLLEDNFEEGERSFAALGARVSRLQPDVIYLPGHGREVGYLVRALKDSSYAGQVLGSVTFESPELLEVAAGSAEGAYYAAPAFDPQSSDEYVKSFRASYVEAYGHEPETFAAHAYDALSILALVISNVGSDPAAVRDSLYQIHGYPGVSGQTSFDRKGDVVKPIAIKTVRNGTFMLHLGAYMPSEKSK